MLTQHAQNEHKSSAPERDHKIFIKAYGLVARRYINDNTRKYSEKAKLKACKDDLEKIHKIKSTLDKNTAALQHLIQYEKYVRDCMLRIANNLNKEGLKNRKINLPIAISNFNAAIDWINAIPQDDRSDEENRTLFCIQYNLCRTQLNKDDFESIFKACQDAIFTSNRLCIKSKDDHFILANIYFTLAETFLKQNTLKETSIACLQILTTLETMVSDDKPQPQPDYFYELLSYTQRTIRDVCLPLGMQKEAIKYSRHALDNIDGIRKPSESIIVIARGIEKKLKSLESTEVTHSVVQSNGSNQTNLEIDRESCFLHHEKYSKTE